jgi:hypothetical protein
MVLNHGLDEKRLERKTGNWFTKKPEPFAPNKRNSILL